MSLFSSIRDFLLGPPDPRDEERRRQLREIEERLVYEWPRADGGKLPEKLMVYWPPSFPLPPAVCEILGEIRRRKEIEEARKKAEAARETPTDHSEILFQRGPKNSFDDYLVRPYRFPMECEEEDDGLTVRDIYRECDPRAFTNRIRQGVRDVYGGDAVPFYTNAGLSRSAYSRLISHPDRHPSKDTALAMAASLHLNLPGAEDFIRLAGYALSPSYPEDVVWRMCFERGVHDIRAIRSLLDKV